MLKESKYLKAFSQTNPADIEIIGDILLIELIPDTEMTTKSGIILSAGLDKNQINGLSADKPQFARVLMAGAGYYDDSASDSIKEVPLDTKPGDIVLVGRTSIKPFSVFGGLISNGQAQVGLCREGDVQIRFRGDDAYNRFFGALNRAAESEARPGGSS